MIHDLLEAWLSPGGVLAVAVIYTAFQQWRAARAHKAQLEALAQVSKRIEEVHLATNGIVEAAFAAKDAVAAAKEIAGIAQGREQMRTEQEKK